MKRVYTSMDPLLVEQVRGLLENAGIRCDVTHRDLRPLAGSVPFVECWPEVWVLDDAQASAAEELVEELEKPSGTHRSRRCERCGEILGDRFTSCWKCEGAADLRAARRQERIAQARVRSAYPRVLLWIALAVMAVASYMMLKAQYGRWP